MKQLAAQSFDILDLVIEGNFTKLASITKGDDDLIQNAHIPTADETQGLSNDNFALVMYDPSFGFMKKLAVYDPYITKLNIEIFKTKTDEFPDELVKIAATFLKKAAKFYHLTLPDTLEKYADESITSNLIDTKSINALHWMQKRKRMEKTAAYTSFAIPSKSKYPIDTPELTKTAIHYFEENYTSFTPKDRLEYALNVKVAAEEMGLDITPLLKYATAIGELNPNFDSQIKIRKYYVGEDNSVKYDGLDKSAGLVKLAVQLEMIDRELGLDKLWTRSIEDPYLTVFATKLAEKSCTHKGKQITATKLASANLDFLDDDLAADLRSDDNVIIYDSLPMPLKDKIANVI